MNRCRVGSGWGKNKKPQGERCRCWQLESGQGELCGKGWREKLAASRVSAVTRYPEPRSWAKAYVLWVFPKVPPQGAAVRGKRWEAEKEGSISSRVNFQAGPHMVTSALIAWSHKAVSRGCVNYCIPRQSVLRNEMILASASAPHWWKFSRGTWILQHLQTLHAGSPTGPTTSHTSKV